MQDKITSIANYVDQSSRHQVHGRQGIKVASFFCSILQWRKCVIYVPIVLRLLSVAAYLSHLPSRRSTVLDAMAQELNTV